MAAAGGAPAGDMGERTVVSDGSEGPIVEVVTRPVSESVAPEDDSSDKVGEES